jgi:hypothetical protein
MLHGASRAETGVGCTSLVEVPQIPSFFLGETAPARVAALARIIANRALLAKAIFRGFGNYTRVAVSEHYHFEH